MYTFSMTFNGAQIALVCFAALGVLLATVVLAAVWFTREEHSLEKRATAMEALLPWLIAAVCFYIGGMLCLGGYMHSIGAWS